MQQPTARQRQGESWEEVQASVLVPDDTVMVKPGERVHANTEVIEVVEEGEMPSSYFLIMHPEARLTPEERATLAKGLDTSIAPL